MDLTAIMKNYADQIGGQYSQYDAEHSIIIVPVSGGRFQTLLGTIKKSDLYNHQLIVLHSKVCAVSANLDYRMLLEQTMFFNYCRFVIDQNYLLIEAVAPVHHLSDDVIKEMMQEVANLADQYEMKLTGNDIY
jgi:hypothetical protein